MSTPKSFSELQTQATQGAFKSSRSVRSGHYVIYTVEGIIVANTSLDAVPADAELITRLLNWAHAGGVERLGLAANQASEWSARMGIYGNAEECEAYKKDEQAFRADLAILNGEATP